MHGENIRNIMVIMRSANIWSMSREMKDKVNRKRDFWVHWLYRLGIKELIGEYVLQLRQKHWLSRNRVAYFVLKKHYSTIAAPGQVQYLMRDIKEKYCGEM